MPILVPIIDRHLTHYIMIKSVMILSHFLTVLLVFLFQQVFIFAVFFGDEALCIPYMKIRGSTYLIMWSRV